jgi:hypothetical protein
MKSFSDLSYDFHCSFCNDGWLTLHEMCKFDTVLCNKEIRSKCDVLPTLCSEQAATSFVVDRSNTEVTDNAFHWLRKIKNVVGQLNVNGHSTFLANHCWSDQMLKKLTEFSFDKLYDIDGIRAIENVLLNSPQLRKLSITNCTSISVVEVLKQLLKSPKESILSLSLNGSLIKIDNADIRAFASRIFTESLPNCSTLNMKDCFSHSWIIFDNIFGDHLAFLGTQQPTKITYIDISNNNHVGWGQIASLLLRYKSTLICLKFENNPYNINRMILRNEIHLFNLLLTPTECDQIINNLVLDTNPEILELRKKTFSAEKYRFFVRSEISMFLFTLVIAKIQLKHFQLIYMAFEITLRTWFMNICIAISTIVTLFCVIAKYQKQIKWCIQNNRKALNFALHKFHHAIIALRAASEFVHTEWCFLISRILLVLLIKVTESKEDYFLIFFLTHILIVYVEVSGENRQLQQI